MTQQPAPNLPSSPEIPQVQFLYGDRMGRAGRLRVGCSVAIFDDQKRILLTRRADTGQWCLPSGQMEPGESPGETAIRETLEETGLHVRLTRLVGVYSDPHQLVIYAGVDKVQIVAIHFDAKIIGGALGLSEETTAFGWFTLDEVKDMDLIGHHKQRVFDSAAQQLDAMFD